MSATEISRLLLESSDLTYDEFSIIGSSCQHIHKPRLDNEQFLLVLHAITVISLGFNVLAVYSIIYKSSENMGRFKWCLLNLQIWTASTDFMIAVLVVPRFYFPVIGGRALGVLLVFGISVPVQIFIGFGCCGAMIASVAVLFIYRHQMVVDVGHRMKLRTRNLAVILGANYLIYMNMTLPALVTAPVDQLAVKIQLLMHERCPPKDLLHTNVYILQSTFRLLPYICFLLVLVGAECGVLALHCSWLLFFSTLTRKLSKKTRMMQVKFLFALVAQIAIPTALCYAPIIYFIITTLIDHYWQFANDVCVFVFATHGLVSALCLLLIYDCYRSHVLWLFCRVARKDSNWTSSRNSVAMATTIRMS